MSRPPTRLAQTILDGPDSSLNRPIITHTIQDLDIPTSDLLSVFSHAEPIGISPGYSAAGKLVSLAIADDKVCRIIEFPQPKKRTDRMPPPTPKADALRGREMLQEVLCRTAGDIFAFDMGPLTMSLYCDLEGIRITNAVDIQSAFSAVDRKPLTGIKAALGDSVKISASNVTNVFLNPIYDVEDRNRTTDLAQRAWVSQFLVRFGNGAETFDKVPRIDTKKLDTNRLDMIAKVANDAIRLDQMKPLQKTYNFSQSSDAKNSQARLVATDYNKKFRKNVNVKLEIAGQQGTFSSPAVMGPVKGKSSNVITDRYLEDKVITKVTSIGRDDPTTAEAQRAATILRILQGSEKLLDESPWIQNIWFPLDDDGLLAWPKEWSEKPKTPRSPIRQPSPLSTQPLNSSQQTAVNCMVSSKDEHRITLIQGPPGTGKTSVIAAFVQYALRHNKEGIWLVAQSNIAVKNIAEKLMSVGFENWRLLVSNAFYEGWHEHLYHKIKNNIVCSDAYSSGSSSLEGCQVMLCTLSMLSNKHIGKFTKKIPLKIMVVDEASQIEVGNYISVFTNFKHMLRKLCFIGDDKQLPPYGQEDLQDLQSIFEIPHLQKQVVFLNTQYRMPPQIGNIISELVYEKKLKSNPSHPITEDMTACYFVEALGKEKGLTTGSFKNEVEASHIIQLAKKLEEKERKYRIITPYEGQRNYIETLMKDEGLEWGDKCFNVDSFQGNEDDFIIISIVRTLRLGFVNDLRRTNVMLTRCKKGMFIVSTPRFLTETAKDSLVGQFVKKVSNPTWLTLEDIQGEKFWEK